MGIGKWITGLLGWAIGGPIGALLGFSLGSLFESASKQTGTGADSGGGYSAQAQRNSFMISLLVLSAAIMKADGKVLRSELDYVKGFIRSNFGDGAVGQALKILQDLLGKEIDLPQVCAQIKTYMDYPQRLQLFHYLTGIARADGSVSKSEIEMLHKISLYLGISVSDSEAILSMFRNTIEDAYKVLEITPDATDEEVKKAYKKMALKHHPDRVAMLGEDVKKAAEEKFKAVGAAYEAIRKERGF